MPEERLYGPAAENVSIIVVAHNAGSLLERTLSAIERQDGCENNSLFLVIAVNGGDEKTIGGARDRLAHLHGSGFVAAVIETAPGRSNALNAAELLLPPGPRIYIDQDAVLSPTAIADLSSALRANGGWHFATPRLELGKSPNLCTRWFYAVWAHLPYVRASPVTIGVYGVSAECRRRWGAFPNLRNDDKFARLHTALSERTVVSSATYAVTLPTGLHSLVAARCRYILYNRELTALCPSLQKNDIPRYAGVLGCIVRRPTLWFPAVVFVLVNAIAAIGAKCKLSNVRGTISTADRGERQRSPQLLPNVEHDLRYRQ